jgi:hypothetical protein
MTKKRGKRHRSKGTLTIEKNADKARDRDKYKIYKTPETDINKALVDIVNPRNPDSPLRAPAPGEEDPWSGYFNPPPISPEIKEFEEHMKDLDEFGYKPTPEEKKLRDMKKKWKKYGTPI